jgi:predicted AAA+ superfamily ATPase
MLNNEQSVKNPLISDDGIIRNQGTNYKTRHLEKAVLSSAQYFKVILILGARQVGKSTLLRHLLPDPEMFFFDTILDPYKVKTDPDFFLDLHAPPLILDEVLFAPALLSAIKRRVDLSTEKGRYFLTGSQNLNVLKTVSETMTGRVVLMNMEGMSLLERMGETSQESWLSRYLNDPEKFLQERPRILSPPPLLEVIWRGSLPLAWELPFTEIPRFFGSYIQTYVERDLRLIEKIDDLQQFGDFLSLLGALSGKEINYSQLGREINMTPQTAKRWLFALSASYQWREILPMHRNTIKKISKKRKGVLTDSGMACYLLRIKSPEDLALHPSLGALFETWAINHVYQLFATCPMTPAIYHWRTHSGSEIDLILELNGIYFPIEFKCSRNISSHDLKSFKAFRESVPEKRVAPGLIIHAGEENYLLDRQTMALSWKAL